MEWVPGGLGVDGLGAGNPEEVEAESIQEEIGHGAPAQDQF